MKGDTKEQQLTVHQDEKRRELTEINERPAHQLDLTSVPRELALPLLSGELAKLASGMTDLKDISVQLDVSPSGATSLKFRAYTRF